MLRAKSIVVLLLCLALWTGSAWSADCDLDEVIGYTIVDSKTVESRIEEDGEREDDFEGCDYGRIIVFSDGTAVRCMDYGYQYAYRPEAYIFANGHLMKMCVEDELYDIGPIR